jgi:hypothetical protein
VELFAWASISTTGSRNVEVLHFGGAAAGPSAVDPSEAAASDARRSSDGGARGFDVRQAMCTHAEDQQLLLGVIDECGGAASFNVWVHELLVRTTPSSCGLTTAGPSDDAVDRRLALPAKMPRM